MIGTYDAKMDDKNRLIVPAKLREELGESFFVTIGVNAGHRCLSVFTRSGWESLSNNFNALPLSQRSGAASLIFSKAVECNPDKQFRFGLGNALMAYAGIDREARIVGKAGQAEIWNPQEHDRFELESMEPDEILASLEAIRI